MHFIQIGDWLLDSQAQQLIKDNETVQLEPISCDLLLCLVNHQSQIVSKDNLIAHVWKNRIVSDSAITRVISMLRKHLGDDPVKPTYIRTIQKQGYLLLAPVRELSEQESKKHQNKKIKSLNRLLTVQNISFLIFFGITVWLSIDNIINSRQLEINANQIKIEPVVTEKGQEAFVTLSPNDEFMVYSHTSMNGGFYHLYHKELNSGKVVQLTHGSHNDYGASVDDNNEMVYFARLVPGQACHIMRLELLSYEIKEPEPIIECSKSLSFNNVSIHPNNNDVYYIDDANGWYVYRFNMQTKEKIRTSNLDQSKVSDYYQKLSPDGKKLVIMRFDNSAIKVVLKQLNQSDHERVIWSSDGYPVYSVSWSKDSSQIYFLEKRYNQLVSYNLTNDHVSVHLLENNRLNSLTNQENNGNIYSVLGNQTQYDITSFPITSKLVPERTLAVASTANDLGAVQLNKQNTFYVSDRSGMFQFWLRDSDGFDVQLSNFEENRSYINLTADPTGENVVGLTDGRLFQFTLASAEFIWLTEKSIRANFPMFSPEGILNYIAKGEKNLLMQYNADGEDSPLIFNAVYAQYLNDDILYQDSDGKIYLVEKGKKTAKLLLTKMIRFNQKRNWISTEEGIYYNRIGNNTNRGLYFQSFDQSPPVLISSSEPNPFGGLSYDRFNHRILLETEEDIDTNIVKVSFPHSTIDGEH